MTNTEIVNSVVLEYVKPRLDYFIPYNERTYITEMIVSKISNVDELVKTIQNFIDEEVLTWFDSWILTKYVLNSSSKENIIKNYEKISHFKCVVEEYFGDEFDNIYKNGSNKLKEKVKILDLYLEKQIKESENLDLHLEK